MNKNISVVLGAVAGLSLVSATAHAQALRPNILVWLDTSGSMLYSQSLDGSPLCNTSMQNTTNGQMSRVYNMKNAIRAALAQVGTDEANFGLAASRNSRTRRRRTARPRTGATARRVTAAPARPAPPWAATSAAR
jgi:hypothetical protein